MRFLLQVTLKKPGSYLVRILKPPQLVRTFAKLLRSFK